MTESGLGRDDYRGHTLLVWDAEGLPPVGNWTTVLWSGFGKADDPNVISIPTLVETQADALKARYLAWIYELGEARINGKRLVDHLELRPGLSYWWMSSLAQKFNASGTSQIDNAIKALAFEGLVAERKPLSIVLVSSNDKLASILQSFCRTGGLNFKWNFVKPSGKSELFTRIAYGLLPSLLRALIYFFWYLIKSLPLLCTKQGAGPVFSGEIAFVDVLVHLDKKAFITGTFISNYWTALVDKLSQSDVKTNWLHNYFHQKSIPTFVHAQKLIDRFNQCPNGTQAHALIEANLSLSVFIKVLKDYFRICRVSSNSSIAHLQHRPASSDIDLWPLFKHEWMDSLRGQSAMVNCLRIALYEKTFSDMPYQKTGVYIQENQPWEMALIYAWKAAGHGKLIGVPHTTVRYGDLRYFYDARNYHRTGKNVLPIPDLVAVNGPVAKKFYLEGGYPEEDVIEVEALRFVHLLGHIPELAPIKSSSKKLNVLVCGDFLPATNFKILSWLEIAAKSLPPEISYVFKPHPACTVKTSDFPSLKLEVTDSPLAELLSDCDVVFTSNITSAAVDAYCSGLPVVQLLEGLAFNMSPLRGLKGVRYVTTPKELADALIDVDDCDYGMTESYFFLNEELPRWRKLISQISGIGISQ